MRRTLGAAAFTAAALCLTSLPAAATAAPAHRPAQPHAQVWLTTADDSAQLQPQAPVDFHPGGSDLTTITVDPNQTFQTMDGFGGAMTDSSAAVLSTLAPAARDAAMRKLFDPRQGIGVSFLRQPVGSSDFTAAAAHYTYDDMPAGQTDFGLAHFSVAHDQAQILPLLRQARKLNPQLTVMATPWSPPAWMKDSDSLVGGHLKDDPAVYQAYARYLVKFVQAYAAAGVPVDYLTVQNEPQNRAPNAYPGTDLPVEAETAVIEALGPLLHKASPRTKILAYDHNWTTHPGDIATAEKLGEDPQTDYPYEVLDSPAARWIAGTAYHCYSGDPSAQSALHDAHPDKGIWFTECSGSHGATDTPAQIFRGTLTWHARTITVGTTRNWAKSVADWNLALDPNGGPHNGGCDTCTALLTVAADGTVTTNAEYSTIGHLSKFVKPGAVRIGSTNYGTTGWNGQLTDVAFRNPDGSTAVVVHNENDDPRSFTVAVGGESFDYTLPGGALATFTWARDARLSSALRELPLDGAVVTASPSASAELAADGDGSTRWTSGAAQTPGQYVQLDLGRRTHFRRVAVDSGDNLGDYARGWVVSLSDDGTHWRAAASGVGTGQLTTVDLRSAFARYVRVTQTAASGSWWSVADLHVYR
ncbi:glycoside hydrolase family 30 beta sandwich domain-containing protein [Actinacidiphila bryophytorum]|uniref:glycoside hydrolase family 30 beta sandwich domain-containing protein n=1 Tax=Actinacidiphila bryophytorum TaxID=1436133 RepID=UPI002176E39D|nr:glycoside hydrolase family 30 beta sandwich domain-containing protein [Actinacidiphila bryophytorum]UWE12223.1 discoidin domain-containing protein [Actinacidiphila bryophytorum]